MVIAVVISFFKESEYSSTLLAVFLLFAARPNSVLCYRKISTLRRQHGRLYMQLPQRTRVLRTGSSRVQRHTLRALNAACKVSRKSGLTPCMGIVCEEFRTIFLVQEVIRGSAYLPRFWYRGN